MKFVHCMILEEKFTKNISSFYDKYFNHGDHSIYYFSRKNDKSINFPFACIKYKIFKNYKYNVLDIVKNINQLRNADFIVLHSLFFNEFYKIIFLLWPRIIKKLIWIEWGYDLYTLTKQNNFIRRTMHKIFCKKIPYFIAIFPPDIDVYKQTFKNSKAKIFYAPYIGYPDGNKGKSYDSTRKLSDIINKKETLYIQIGHNAMPTLNHIEVLNALKHFSNENIKIILPLSYGNKEYADKVENYAKQLFSDKVICLRNFLSPDKYFDIIDKVSICIFNTQRQCALGNIHHMIFRNTKLFMPQDSVMFRYFNGRGVPIYSFDGIEKMDFKEFTSDVVIRDINNFNNYIEELTNYERKVALWKNIYDEIEKDCKK